MMRYGTLGCGTAVALFLAWFSFAAAPLRAADANENSALARRAGELIGQLGDPSYAVRQRATRQLLELGPPAQPFLTGALELEDAEVRSRAAFVLAQVADADFRARLEAFANDPEGKLKLSLPSWDSFSRSFGSDKTARGVFVDMQRAEPGLLESLEASSKLAGEMFEARLLSIIQMVQFPQNNGAGVSIGLGTLNALLFVSGSEGVAVSDQSAIQLYNLIHQSAFQNSLRGDANGRVLKKIVGRWIVHNSGSAIAYQNLMLAFNFDLPEGLDLAIKMIGNDGGQPFIRQYVILAIGRFGNHEHIALIEPLLKDANPCMPQQQALPDPRQSQIRDVALGVLIVLSGQELKDYGLGHVVRNSQMLFQPGTVTFAEPAQRDAALKKWQQWSSGRKSPDSSGDAAQPAEKAPDAAAPAATPAEAATPDASSADAADAEDLEPADAAVEEDPFQ